MHGRGPFYGQCTGAGPQDGTPNPLVGRLVVLLASVLPDGDDVTLLASVPNHAAPPAEVPPPVDLTNLACFSEDQRGAEAVGMGRDITEGY